MQKVRLNRKHGFYYNFFNFLHKLISVAIMLQLEPLHDRLESSFMSLLFPIRHLILLRLFVDCIVCKMHKEIVQVLRTIPVWLKFISSKSNHAIFV